MAKIKHQVLLRIWSKLTLKLLGGKYISTTTSIKYLAIPIKANYTCNPIISLTYIPKRNCTYVHQKTSIRMFTEAFLKVVSN